MRNDSKCVVENASSVENWKREMDPFLNPFLPITKSGSFWIMDRKLLIE